MHVSLGAVAAIIAALGASVPALSANLTVSVDVAQPPADREFRVIVEGTAAGAVPIRTVARGAAPSRLDLPVGTYRIVLAETDYWADTRVVYVPEGGATAQLAVYRASSIAGRIVMKDRTDSVPRTLIARFQASHDAARGPRGEVPCDIVGREFFCRVPAARLDVSLKAPRHITRYRNALDAGSKPATWGVLDLVPGALLTGYVSAPRGTRLEKARVRATPRRTAPTFHDVHDEKAQLGDLSVPVDARGFFHFDGIAPGEYTIEASLGSLKSWRTAVAVIELAEGELRETLELREPHDLELAVEPVRDPYNRPWIASLERLTDVAMVSEVEQNGVFSRDGRTTLRAIPAGDYTVVLRSEGGEVWARRDVTVPLVSHVEITLPKTLIRGRLTLGDEPLAADLQIGGGEGLLIAARADSDGRFRFFYPEQNVTSIARVRVRSGSPTIDRKLTGVKVERDDEGRSTMNIALPSTYLTGAVVDTEGKPIPRAVVRLHSEGAATNQDVPVASDGSFEVHGLAAGRVDMTADAVNGKSNTVTVHLGENGSADSVRLVVRPTQHLRGHVLSPSGPVPGAIVYAFPVPRDASLSSTLATGADGRYGISLPAHTQEVDVFVSAPTFGTQFFRHRLAKERDLDVTLSQLTGTLLVDAAHEDDLQLVHRGATVAARLFRYHAGAVRGSLFRIEGLEPGGYSICKGSDCVGVTVVPNGEVHARHN